MAQVASKILIVDDHDSNRIALEKLLRAVDHIEIYHAASGNEALSSLIRHKFALILLDVNMPEMDGYEVAELISSTDAHKHTPIVMLTAHDPSAQNILKAYQSGAVDYLAKPIEPTILLNKVNQFVTLNQLQKKTYSLKSERESILEAVGQGVIKIGTCGLIKFANSKSCQLLNQNINDLSETHFNQWFQFNKQDFNQPVNFFNYIQEKVKKQGLFQQQEITLKPTDSPELQVEITCTPVSNVKNSSMIILFQDITKRLEMENKLTHLANFDPLTQLANRAYFHENVNRAIARAKRIKSTIILLMLDLDHFKQINDTLGHDIGDELLQEVASRLKFMLRESDMPVRLGGDEFAILLEDTSEQAAKIVARKIIKLISTPFIIQDKEIFIETSIGIACCQNGSIDMSTLLKWADIALYEAKSTGRNCYQLFMPSMSEQREQHAFIQGKLRHILEANALSVHYQPQYSLSENCIVGFEALARWPQQGYGKEIISPATFIPIAEQSHLIHEIGEQVLKQTCELLQRWQKQPDNKHLRISVNLSPKQLNAPNFLENLRKTLSQYQFPLQKLIFEITETAILNHTVTVTQTINTIKSMGIHLALDDFGTGYSSLNYLQNLPYDMIKIDQSFIHRLASCNKTYALVKAIMTIATACEMDVVAEGVETSEQLEQVEALGCNKIQGYYYSKPLTKDQLNALLANKSNQTLKRAEMNQVLQNQT